MTSAAPAPACREYWEEYDVDSSPDTDRCLPCTEEQAWHDGWPITGKPPFGEGVVLVAPFDLIVSAPAGREQEEG